MKRRFFIKFFSILPIFACLLAFNTHGKNYISDSAVTCVNVKRLNDVNLDKLTRDDDLGILGGLEAGRTYNLVPMNAEEPYETNSFQVTANENGEISLLDDIGEVENEIGLTIYGQIIEQIYVDGDKSTLTTLNPLFKFPTKEKCMFNLVGDGETRAYTNLEALREEVKDDSYSGELTNDQEAYFNNAKQSFTDIYAHHTDYTPAEVVKKTDETLNDVKTKTYFINYKIHQMNEINNANAGLNDEVITSLITTTNKDLEKNYSPETNTIDDIKQLVAGFESQLKIRTNVQKRLNDLDVKLSTDVYPRKKPLALRTKADELKEEYYYKINLSQSIKEADSLYEEFSAKIDHLILETSWGRYCYTHWIYIVVLTIYGAYFVIRGLFLKYRRFDLINILSVAVFAICTIAFTLFSACDVCTIMIISGWSLLVVSLAVFSIYTFIGSSFPIYKTITDEDVEIALYHQKTKERRAKREKEAELLSNEIKY